MSNGGGFPLDEASEHLSRLRHWGFNTLRFLVTWEAVEHSGPGQYDLEYLDYLVAVLEQARLHDFFVFIDFHQDVWSRMSGGSGAPGWLFEAIGLDATLFARSGGALVMQHAFDYASPEDHQPSYPMMSWASNYQRPVNGVMWTAFFAGRLLTPDWLIQGENIQRYLQRHYLGAMRAVAERVRHLSNVIGFDTLNEPGYGWIGQTLSKRPNLPSPGEISRLRPGPLWTPLDGLRLVEGQTVRMPQLGRDARSGALQVVGERVFNEDRIRLWMPGVEDPFQAHGAWRAVGDAGAEVLNESFFTHHEGQPLHLTRDAMGPFFEQVARTIREVRSDWLLFAELDPFSVAVGERFPAQMPQRWVNANHWYDIECLRTKRAPDKSRGQLVERYRPELGTINELGANHQIPAPTLVGEFGIQFDLDDADAYRRWQSGETDSGIWDRHIPPLAAAYDVLDELLASGTQWNYTASNRNDPRIGDRWNQEDLSIFSRDQQLDPSDLDSGGRALAGFVRPYVQKAQGNLRSMQYAQSEARLIVELEADATIAAPTVIFAPRDNFGSVLIETDANVRWEFSLADQRISVWAECSGPLRLVLTGGPSDAGGQTATQ